MLSSQSGEYGGMGEQLRLVVTHMETACTFYAYREVNNVLKLLIFSTSSHDLRQEEKRVLDDIVPAIEGVMTALPEIETPRNPEVKTPSLSNLHQCNDNSSMPFAVGPSSAGCFKCLCS